MIKTVLIFYPGCTIYHRDGPFLFSKLFENHVSDGRARLLPSLFF